MDQEKRSKISLIAIHGTLWTYITRYAGKPVGFVSTLILVRLLSPEDFGLAAYSLALIAFLSPLSTLCLDLAIVYYNDDDTPNTAFWMGLGFGSFLFILIVLVSPLLQRVFPDPQISDITRVLALTLPLNALFLVHSSLLQKRFAFDKEAPPAVAGAVSKGLISVVLALQGLGVWAIVWAEVISTILVLVSYWVVLPWRPAFRFNIRQSWRILTYSGPMLVSNLFAIFMANASKLLMGPALGAVSLGVYNVASRFPNFLIMDLSLVQSRVFFPLYVKYQNDRRAQSEALSQTLRQLFFLVVPVSLGLIIFARPLVLALLSKDWQAAIPVVQVLAVYSLIYAFERLGNAWMRAQGYLKMFIFLMVFRSALFLPALWWAVTIQRSIVTVGWVYVAVSLVSSCVIVAVITRRLKFSWLELSGSLWPSLVCGGLMGIAMLSVRQVLGSVHPVAQIFLGTLTGGVVYFLASWWLQRDVISAVLVVLGMFLGRIPRPVFVTKLFNRVEE